MPRKQLRDKKYQKLTPKEKIFFKLIDELDNNWKDQLNGGLADNNTPSDFCPHQLAKGIDVELEHTNDIEKATEIAMDHLQESKDFNRKGNPNKGGKYYDRLEEMEKNIEEKIAQKNIGRVPVNLADEMKNLVLWNNELKTKLKQTEPLSNEEDELMEQIRYNNRVLFDLRDELIRKKKQRENKIMANSYCFFKLS